MPDGPVVGKALGAGQVEGDGGRAVLVKPLGVVRAASAPSKRRTTAWMALS